MPKEGLKKTTGESASTTELLEAEVRGDTVTVTVRGVELEVNPRAVNSGPALRAMMEQNNPWPMYGLLVPDSEKQEELEATLPADDDYGYDIDDFSEMFQELFGEVAGKKASKR